MQIKKHRAAKQQWSVSNALLSAGFLLSSFLLRAPAQLLCNAGHCLVFRAIFQEGKAKISLQGMWILGKKGRPTSVGFLGCLCGYPCASGASLGGLYPVLTGYTFELLFTRFQSMNLDTKLTGTSAIDAKAPANSKSLRPESSGRRPGPAFGQI